MKPLDLIRGAVRPVVTVVLVLAQIAFVGAGIYTGDFEAAKVLAPFTMMPLTYWYVERTISRRDQAAP